MGFTALWSDDLGQQLHFWASATSSGNKSVPFPPCYSVGLWGPRGWNWYFDTFKICLWCLSCSIGEVINPTHAGECLIRTTVHFLIANYHGDANVHGFSHYWSSLITIKHITCNETEQCLKQLHVGHICLRAHVCCDSQESLHTNQLKHISKAVR